MLVCTSVLRRAPIRIGGLGERITFHRTVRLAAVVAGALGGLAGLFLGGVVSVFVGGFNALLYSSVVGVMCGLAAESWSPLRGESMLRWFGLMVTTSARRRIDVNGTAKRAYIGLCALSRVAHGPVQFRGAADELEGSPGNGPLLRPGPVRARQPRMDGAGPHTTPTERGLNHPAGATA